MLSKCNGCLCRKDRIKAYEIPVAFLSDFDSNDIDELFIGV